MQKKKEAKQLKKAKRKKKCCLAFSVNWTVQSTVKHWSLLVYVIITK